LTSSIVYLNDVLILSKTFDQTCTHLKSMFDIFRKANCDWMGKVLFCGDTGRLSELCFKERTANGSG